MPQKQAPSLGASSNLHTFVTGSCRSLTSLHPLTNRSCDGLSKKIPVHPSTEKSTQKNSKTTPIWDGKNENFFVFTNELHAQPQASHSKSMLSVWPSRQRATLAILKLLPVSKLFAAAVTDGIQARQHARFIRPHMTTPPFKRRWPLSQRL